MCLCVCSWMGGQGRDLISGIFEAAPECPKDLPFSILVRKLHGELCPWKPARPEERTKAVIQSGAEGCQLGVRHWSGQYAAEGQLSGSETPEHRVRVVKTMTSWVSIFGRCVGLSQSSRDGYEHKYILECFKMPDFTFWVLQL